MLVRVYQPVSGGVRILSPNAALRADGEAESVFLARIALEAAGADATLVGLPYADVDVATIPAERNRTVGQKIVDTTAAWRLVNGAVVIDETVVTALAGG